MIAAQKAEAEAMIAGYAASRDKAPRDLDATVLRAPFDGTVGNLSVAAGDLVAPGKRLLAVVPLGRSTSRRTSRRPRSPSWRRAPRSTCTSTPSPTAT